ncbi:MAG: sensor domain-containing diguanylate cyclase [Nevskia sp.]|nr:sensor domain-containing diguanylate cyclase [Nevskia sp.]
MAWMLAKAWRWLPLLCVLGCAQAWGAPPPLIVQAADGKVSLLPRAELLEDPGGRLGLAQAMRDEAGWKSPAAGDTRNFGFTHSTWWLRLRLQGGSGGAQTRILELASSLQDYMDLYLVRPSGAVLASYHTGDQRPFRQRGLDYRNPAFPLILSADEPVDVYLRLDTRDGLYETFGVDLWSPPAFMTAAHTEALLYGLYFGILLALLAYNLLLFVSTRDRSFGLYVVYVGSFFVWNFICAGYAFQYLWPDQPRLNNLMFALTGIGSFFSFMLFIGEYVQVGNTPLRWLLPLYRMGTVFCLLGCLPELAGNHALGYMLEFPIFIVVVSMCLAIGVKMALDPSLPGSRAARYALLAFSPIAVAIPLYYLSSVGLLASTVLTRNMMQIGSAAEVLLLAFGLADRMNTLKAQKLAAERSAREAQAALATRLEQQVRERTRELEQANLQLASAAITDELTGAFNRRHFNEIFAAEIRRRRGEQQLAFCIFDVDHFKSYNDRYGHQMGDEVLHTVAAALRSRLQRSGDKLFRLGGEEFGIVIGVDDVDKARGFVDALRSEVEALKIPHESAPLGIVTASFGLLVVAAADPDAQPKDIYAAADALLYQAKSAGRNRIQCGVA